MNKNFIHLSLVSSISEDIVHIYKNSELGKGDHGWLKSNFHFSFANYYNPKRMGLGDLRVLNDDRVMPGTGFDTHPHKNMEIISYVIEGGLTHKDSMGTEETLYPGEIQYMSAGTGVTHSEYNHGKNLLRFAQIWIVPDRDNHSPNYGSYRFKMEERQDQWLHMVSGKTENGVIKINQDSNIYSALISKDRELEFTINKNRQVYGMVIGGSVTIEDRNLKIGDGFDTNSSINFRAIENSHVLLIEMKEK